MNEFKRKIKKGEVLFGWIIFFSLVGFLIYNLFFYKEKVLATCFDGIKNQGEEGVDCGGPCAPCKFEKNVVIKDPVFFKFGDYYYKVGFLLENKNPDIAYKKIKFKVRFFENKTLLTQKEFEAQINQAESRIIFSPKFFIGDEFPTNIEVFAEKFAKYEGKLKFLKQLPFSNIRIETMNNEKIIIKGEVTNDTSINYKELQVVVAFFEDDKKLVYGDSTFLFDILPQEKRDFLIELPYLNNLNLNNFKVFNYANSTL